MRRETFLEKAQLRIVYSQCMTDKKKKRKEHLGGGFSCFTEGGGCETEYISNRISMK